MRYRTIARPGWKSRRDFLSSAGKGLGLAAISYASVGALLRDIETSANSVEDLSPLQAASEEDFWSEIQQSFSVTRGIINLNNGGRSEEHTSELQSHSFI